MINGKQYKIFAFICMLANIALNIVLNATVIYFLWNWLIPSIFELKTINFVQAIGLFLLVQGLLGNVFKTNMKI